MMRSLQPKGSFLGNKQKVKKLCFASVNRILLKIFHLSNIKQIMHYINTQLLHQLEVYRSEHVKERSLATDRKDLIAKILAKKRMKEYSDWENIKYRRLRMYQKCLLP